MTDHRDMDLSAVHELTAIARSVKADDRALMTPPPDLWHAIEAEAFGVETDTTVVQGGFRQWIAPAAVAAAVLLLAGIALSLRSSGPDVVAEAELASLDPAYVGSAALVDGDEGFEIRLDLSGDQPSDGYLELWLIKDLETGEMQSLGPIGADEVFVLPDGLDPSQYATIDVSVEPLDGIPTHSGNSVLRGPLADT